MKVQIEYTAQLRTALGRAGDDLEIAEGTTLLGLLERLAGCDGARGHLLTEEGRPRPSLLVVHNGTPVPARDAPATILSPGDVVTLLPPIAGG